MVFSVSAPSESLRCSNSYSNSGGFGLTGEYSAQPNKRESPFLGLPNELRNEIYRYALGGKDYESMFGADSKPLQDKPDKKSISLLSVCFQIYMDTVVLPFELNTFQFEDSIDLSAWISALRPGQRDAIRALKYMAWGPSIISLRPENSYSMKRFVRLKEFSSLKRVYVYYKERREDSDGIALQDDSIEKLIKAALPNKDIEVIFESPDGGR